MSYVKETKTTVSSKTTVSIDRTCPACGVKIHSTSTATSTATYTAQGHGDQGDVLRAKELADAGLKSAAETKIAEMEKMDSTYGIICQTCSRITPAFEQRVLAEGGMRKMVEKMCNPSPMGKLFKSILGGFIFVIIGFVPTYIGFTSESGGGLILFARYGGIFFMLVGIAMIVQEIVSSHQSEKAYSPYKARVEALSDEAANRVVRQSILAGGNTWEDETRSTVFNILGKHGNEKRSSST